MKPKPDRVTETSVRVGESRTPKHGLKPKVAASTSPSARLTFSIEGMTCQNCARHVTDAIQQLPGIRQATVNLQDNRAVVRWQPDQQPNPAAVQQAVAKAGFQARPITQPGSAASTPSASSWKSGLLFGIGALVWLMFGEWIAGWHHLAWFRWMAFVLASLVQFGPGRQFYKGAWSQLKVGRSNMDTLVALGSTTAFVYSVYLLLSGRPDHLYFMEAVAIISLISLGHWFEARTSAKAGEALRSLLHLAPDLARRLTSDDREEEVRTSDLRLNDRLVLRPGDRVPTDGQVTEGQSAVDESMLTGESMPVEKETGAKLYGGTVNLNGRLIMTVRATGEETALAHIIAAVERAQSSRANIQRLADQVSSIFVPIVVFIAAAGAMWWGFAPDSARSVHDALAPYLWPAALPTTTAAAAVVCAVAILIVACPCAMGLATPAAIMAGSNAAAKRGILIRDGVVLEKAGIITTIVFDKTGTLTHGKPSLAAQELSAPDQLDPLLLAAALAGPSRHPLSQAITRLRPAQPHLPHWTEHRGFGVEARIDNQPLRLGSIAWMRECGVDLNPTFVQHWMDQGATVLALARGTQALALFALQDQLKPGAREVISTLKKQGLAVHLLTGDHKATAQAIGRGAGIDHVHAEVRPEQKAELISRLQAQGERVAFVGDGINDAPALEQADLGIAVSQASDIAREAADIVLLTSEIEAVPESLGLARATLRTIKQNLFWAFFYNGLAVPLALLGFLSPILCAAAMGLSDLIVIGNALRLRAFGQSQQP